MNEEKTNNILLFNVLLYICILILIFLVLIYTVALLIFSYINESKERKKE